MMLATLYSGRIAMLVLAGFLAADGPSNSVGPVTLLDAPAALTQSEPAAANVPNVVNDGNVVAAAEKPKEKPVDGPTQAVLTVVVTGNGRPIEKAEVKLKFPPSVGRDDETQFTDVAGQVTFKSTPGSAKVRVIADGWVAVLKEIELKKGAQTVPVTAEPL